jgi:DNA repair protein RecN (Recombination protein N)
MFCGISDECRALLDELGIECEEDGVLLARSITQSSSTARINGRAVTLSMLREVSGKLFGIHGQNDNQQLLDPQNHIKLIDGYAANGELLERYAQVYREILGVRCEIDSAERDTMEKARLCEILKFQIKDIDAVKPKKNEEQELEDIVTRLSSAEKINKCRALIDKALRGGEKGGAIYLVDRANAAADTISESLPEASALAQRLSDVRYELEDIEKRLEWLSEDVDELEKDAVDCKNDPSDLTEWERARAIELGKDKIIKLCQNEDELLKKYNKCINDLINLSMRSSVESFEIFKKLEMK